MITVNMVNNSFKEKGPPSKTVYKIISSAGRKHMRILKNVVRWLATGRCKPFSEFVNLEQETVLELNCRFK